MKIGVLLSGCGIYDGSGIHEAVLSLLMLDRLSVDYECFAPDNQSDVCNPITRDKLPHQRNVLIESARIARGKIEPLTAFRVETFDGIVIPGSYHDLSEPAPAEITDVICRMVAAGKPIAATSTSAMWVADALNKIDIPAKITLGNPHYYADNQALNQWIQQAKLREINVVDADAADVVEDDLNNIITTPGYLSSRSMAQVFEGIEKTITKLIEMVTLVMNT
jgi:enhancing lycopene biosynthesis protein 2